MTKAELSALVEALQGDLAASRESIAHLQARCGHLEEKILDRDVRLEMMLIEADAYRTQLREVLIEQARSHRGWAA